MKTKNIFIALIAFLSWFNLGRVENANANLKNSFNESKECTFENAHYLWPGVNARYCVEGKKVFEILEGSSKAKFIGVLDEKKRETKTKTSKYFAPTYSYYLSEFFIEGNKLLYYKCNLINGPDEDCKFKRENGSYIKGWNIDKMWNNAKKKMEGLNGLHSYIWEDGSKYFGEFSNGRLHGKGILIWADGLRYHGRFEDNKRTGKGTLTWVNGDKYVGDFVNNQRTGKGTLTWINGAKYYGDFLNGKMNGYGKYTDQRGTVGGIFKNDKFIKKYSEWDYYNVYGEDNYYKRKNTNN